MAYVYCMKSVFIFCIIIAFKMNSTCNWCIYCSYYYHLTSHHLHWLFSFWSFHCFTTSLVFRHFKLYFIRNNEQCLFFIIFPLFFQNTIFQTFEIITISMIKFCFPYSLINMPSSMMLVYAASRKCSPFCRTCLACVLCTLYITLLVLY